MAKKKDLEKDIAYYIKSLQSKESRLKGQHIGKKRADAKYGEERADLIRIIEELNKSISELPEGSLRAASIERRDEMEIRLKNLTVRYPKGCDKPDSYYEIWIKHCADEIALHQQQLEQIKAEQAALQNKITHTPTLIVVSIPETETKSDAEPEAGKEDMTKEDEEMK